MKRDLSQFTKQIPIQVLGTRLTSRITFFSFYNNIKNFKPKEKLNDSNTSFTSIKANSERVVPYLQNYVLDSSFSMMPHPKKMDKGGEDSFYISANLVAVADGVGSWNNLNVNPKDYSTQLTTKFRFKQS